MKFGVADYGMNVWYGGLYDIEERLLDLKALGFNGTERLVATSEADAMQKAALFRKLGMDFSTCLGPNVQANIQWSADHYIACSGTQSWESGDWRHFRYVQLTFRDLPDELTLEEVWAEEICNHFEYRGQFSSNDPRLGMHLECKGYMFNTESVLNKIRQLKLYLNHDLPLLKCPSIN